jgi:hypothetical protein
MTRNVKRSSDTSRASDRALKEDFVLSPAGKIAFRRLLQTLVCIVATTVSLSSQAEIFSIIETKPISEIWLNPGAYSFHFQRDKGFDNNNIGLGGEYRYSTTGSVMLGVFHNSDRDTSHYVAWHWRPLGLGPVHLGAVVGVIDGYPLMLDGGWFPVVIPMLSFEYHSIGANLLLVPSYQNRLHGAISLQLKLRVF